MLSFYEHLILLFEENVPFQGGVCLSVNPTPSSFPLPPQVGLRPLTPHLHPIPAAGQVVASIPSTCQSLSPLDLPDSVQLESLSFSRRNGCLATT